MTKYRLGSLTVEAIDTYVRISVEDIGTFVTKQEYPTAVDVAQLIYDIRGYWPDEAVLIACGRAAEDARNNKNILDI